jgi:hypothetical protein
MPNFKVVKQVSFPLLKQGLNVPVHIRIESKIKVSEVQIKKTAGAEQMKPAEVCEVTDLEAPESGRFLFIVNAVLKSELEKTYPGAAYVGKSFRVVKLPKSEGKSYNPFMIAEVQIEK